MYLDFLTCMRSQPEIDAGLSSIELYSAPSGRAFLCQCEFNIAQCDIKLAEKLNIEVPETIHRSVTKRRAEFIAGRYMAKLCLKTLSVADHHISIGSHREPLWPEKLTGSISHTNNRAIALVAERDAHQFVGLDVENWLNADTAEQIGSNIHDKSEVDLLREQGLSFEGATSIIFSAKESLFKATFPYIGHYFGFECARVVGINIREQWIALELDRSLSHYCANKHIFKCLYFSSETSVTTVILSN